ncbi:MAG: polyprenol monophosphomannose synthase [Verrucomicrobiota bacterium]|jgi:dolichol-phosphate mannosyltransferase|nr:polyprenol monophosphomannose synthase [Verrucomicrobiota bacterium]
MIDTLVIIPTYNEMANAEAIATAVLGACPEADVLFVDDNSPDGTGRLAARLAAENSRIHVLHRERKQGLGRAYLAGFRWALERPQYQFILEMDADFSHDPAAVPQLRAAAQTADVALGSRYVGGIRVINWPMSRLVLSTAAALYVRIITGMPFSDPTGGFKCFRRAVLQTIDLDQIQANGYAFQIEMTHRAWHLGFKVVESPIVFEERREGQSKMNGGIINEALWMVWKLQARCHFRRRPGKTNPESVQAVRETV